MKKSLKQKHIHNLSSGDDEDCEADLLSNSDYNVASVSENSNKAMFIKNNFMASSDFDEH